MKTLVSSGKQRFRLRDYQQAAVKAVHEYGKPRPVLVAATGAGKTVIASKIAVDRLQRGPVLFLAHRDELLDQTLEKFAAVFDSFGEAGRRVTVGRIQAEADDVAADFAVASVQTISQPVRLSRWMAAHDTTPTLITDECHHARAASYMRVYEALGFLGDGVREGTLHLGLTATPYRADGAGLRKVFDGVAYAIGVTRLIEEGYLVPPKAMQLAIVEGLEEARSGGDWTDTELSGLVNTPSVNERIVEAWKEHVQDRLTIAFCVSVEHAEALAVAFEAAGVKAATVTGAMPKDERRATLDAFSRGEVRVVCNYGVLTEGFDRPEVSCLIMARPTTSHGLYTQMVGRGLRLAPHVGKTDCLVLDVVGVTELHRLMTVDRLLTGADEAAPGAGLEGPVGIGGGGSSKVVPPTRFRWLQVRDSVWLARDFAGRFVRVERLPGDVWQVAAGSWASARENARRADSGLEPVPAGVDVVYQGANAEMAWGYAATYARVHLQRRAVEEGALWMDLPPTEKQVEALMRRGLLPPTTRWEAMAMLTLPTPRQMSVLRRMFAEMRLQDALLPDTMDEAAVLLDEAARLRRGDRAAFLGSYARALPHRVKLFAAGASAARDTADAVQSAV
ncbi:DEAD/DEAH box helicase [Alicyclobacillus macrosporangiidus]|uniref:DEAD/DEAH box helicase n=1 Tax=Alicyclobacillus macrosporangiidus TaxID=392015 RepID=UPI00068DAE43|nr:DEAD/DEAH box helicase [Alicyclobacillus macrosporangiidus]